MPTETIRALKNAVAFLKRTGRIKKHEDVATATNISASLLSQILSGKKNPTEEWLKLFETTYKLDLKNRLTYIDVSDVPMEGFPEVMTPEAYMETYRVMRDLILAKDVQIEAQARMLHEQGTSLLQMRRQIQLLTEVFLKYEQTVLQAHLEQRGNNEMKLGTGNYPQEVGEAMMRFFKEIGILEEMRSKQDPEKEL